MSEVHSNHVLVQRGTSVGLITLNRAEAMNALSLDMIQTITQALRQWRDDPSIAAVALRGSNKGGSAGSPERWFGHFCAGGDIRFFHDAAKANDPRLEQFFTQEYALNHLIHTYGKPIVAFMDGVVMGGGMGLCQGIALRLVTEKTKMAMPETKIGLFPDVGGGYFLSRCPGSVGEYLALTGQMIGADAAIAYGLADVRMAAADQAPLWEALATGAFSSGEQALQWLRERLPAREAVQAPPAAVEAVFGLPSVAAILSELDRTPGDWARETAAALRERSPLMLHVALEQIRRARAMGLADELRMECDMVWRCFHHRPVADSETVEGIRALAVDKDHAPRWKPATVAQVDAQEVADFFKSPWTADSHPLRHLS
jgi:enoyl-CoA hydratase/carnithine racemase